MEQLRQAYAQLLCHRRADRRGCVPPNELLALAEMRTAEDLRLELLDHVMGCGACHREYELLRAICRGRRQLR